MSEQRLAARLPCWIQSVCSAPVPSAPLPPLTQLPSIRGKGALEAAGEILLLEEAPFQISLPFSISRTAREGSNGWLERLFPGREV